MNCILNRFLFNPNKHKNKVDFIHIMGNSGSYTAKASINPCLFVFTKWGTPEIREFLNRGQQELPETFALRKHEFEFLLGQEMVDYNTSRVLFNDIFDLDRNSLVDKFEVMCIVCLTSKVDNVEKIHFFFDLFNFNNKGYLFESELTLLILAVTRGVFKADQKYLPPNNRTVALLVQEAFLHAKVDPTTIRKPELVNFALGNLEVLSFLESWRGHASQVLLSEDEKWRDLTFPCSETSIVPSRDYYKLGFPLKTFIRWRRRDKAGIDLGFLEVYTHELSFLKTVDRRIVYTGEGIIGRGFLRQGLLADRWFLNALATMTSRPDTILSCLASTGQEDRGRFCTRFYESSGWRSVNVDDRIPCSPDKHPLFATSSHSLEAWPMILEKGLAKYLGSYGRLGMCGVRGDATEAALRLLTGGHVHKLHIQDFAWRSVEEDVVGQSGGAFVKKCLTEGSLIAFGKSESMALMQHKVAKPPSTTTGTEGEGENASHPLEQPYGRLFPIVGTLLSKGYTYLILRDAFGLIEDCDLNVNFESGHSRTFKTKIEDIPLIYDTIIISRFPDSLRINAEKLRLRPWRSEVICQDTRSPEAPAKFLLSVSKQTSNGIRLNPIKRMGDIAANITAVLNESDGKVRSELEDVMTLKEKVDFSRVKLSKEAFQEAKKNDTKVDGKGSSKTATPKPSRRASILKKQTDQDLYEVVDLSLTLSSSCDWSFSGSEAAAPKIRVRITPTPDTLERMQERDRQIEAMRRQIRELAEARRLAAIKLDQELAAAAALKTTGDEEEEGNVTVTENSLGATSTNISSVETGLKEANTGILAADTTAPQHTLENNRSEENIPTAGTKTDKAKYDIILSAERSWLSHSLQLFPGDYYIFADVSFAVPYEEAFNMTVPAHISEAPWLDAKQPGNHVHTAKKDTSSALSFTRRSSTAIVTSPSKSKLVIPAGMGLNAASAGGSVNASSNGLSGADSLPDLSKLPQIWLQVSSFESFVAKPIQKKDVPVGVSTSLASVQVEPERWPFSSETQEDASSRMLMNMLTRSKTEAQLVGLQFMTLVNQYKEQRKQQQYSALAMTSTAEEPPHSPLR